MPARDGLRVFDGAVAIVTGGASGIGRGIAEELAMRGARVVIADLQVELAEEVAAGIEARAGAATGRYLDVVDFAGVGALVNDVVERWGRLDFMFNNAGITVGGEVRLHGIDDWNRIIDVNLRGVVNGIQAAYPLMLRQGFGHLVNTASLQGLVATPTSVSYAATKHAVVGLSKSLRAEAAPAGVRVSVLCPGIVRTPILRGGKYGRILVDLPDDFDMWERARPMDPAVFARKVLRRVAANGAIIIVPSWWRVLWWIDRASPRVAMHLAERFFVSTKARLERSRM